MFANKKAIFNRVTVLFALIIFGLIYFGGLASGIGGAVCEASEEQNNVGLYAFVMCNINLFIFIFWIIAIIATATVV